MIATEESIAIFAYQNAAKIAIDTEHQRERQRQMKRLADLYVDLGFAKGTHEANQLIREIELQAATQAVSRVSWRRGPQK
jgi:hypothetical protein